MAPQSTQPLCTSKRKREAVVYYESSSSESEEDLSPTKKSKRSPTTSTRPLPKHKIFPFTTLPPELRNRIYALCLTDPNGIDLASKMRAYRRTVSRTIIARDEDGNGKHTTRFMDVPAPDTSELPVLAPHLLRLNKEIHAEAQPILYGGNVFALEDTMALHAFLATIGSENCASLLEVEIMGWGFTKAHKAMNHPAFTLLKEAVNLRRLRLACRVRYWGDITQVARAVCLHLSVLVFLGGEILNGWPCADGGDRSIGMAITGSTPLVAPRGSEMLGSISS